MLGNALVLAALMVVPVQSRQNSPAFQEQVGQIATGVIVEVRTKLKAMKKVTGRLGKVTAEGFEVQVSQGQRVDNLKLRFADVKSVREKHGMGPRAKALVVALGVWGALTLLGVMVGG